jgi:proteasome accessory factor A
MLNRIFGLETEYGLLVNQDRPDHSPTWTAHQIRDHIFYRKHRGLVDVHHRGHDEPPGNGGFLTNAGRIYLDMGHLEFASPECNSLTDLISSDRAGDQILQQAIDEMGLADRVSLIKNNIDHDTDATFGSHENYLVSRNFPFSRRGLGLLIPFLVTRQIFTGTGRIGMASPEGWNPVILNIDGRIWQREPMATREVDETAMGPFQISQRADHIVNDFFQWVQGNRAIINTRDEPLADPNQFRRIHLLVGDSNMAEVATALKIGTTSLVLQLIEEGHCPAGLDLDDPVEALKAVSRDPDRQWIVTLDSGKTISSIDVQEQYLQAAQGCFRGQDPETDWVLAEWESILKDLRGDYCKLIGRVDWASKLWLLESFRSAEKLEWSDPWLKSLDMEYHNLHPDKGLYFGLLQEGRAPRLTTDSAIALAEEHPPRNTRAYGRGEVIRHLLRSGEAVQPGVDQEERRYPAYIINWSAFHLRGRTPFPMPDPFKTYVQEVRDHLKADCPTQ